MKSWLGGISLSVVVFFGGCSHLLVYLREKNDKIFKGTSSSSAKLIDKVTLTTAKWTFVEFSNFILNDIIFNWEACVGCGPIKVRRSIFFIFSPYKYA